MWNIDTGPLILSHCRPFFEGCSSAGTGGKANPEILTLCGWQRLKFDELDEVNSMVRQVWPQSNYAGLWVCTKIFLSSNFHQCNLDKPLCSPSCCQLFLPLLCIFLWPGRLEPMVSRYPHHAHMIKVKERTKGGAERSASPQKSHPQSNGTLTFRIFMWTRPRCLTSWQISSGMCQGNFSLWKTNTAASRIIAKYRLMHPVILMTSFQPMPCQKLILMVFALAASHVHPSLAG